MELSSLEEYLLNEYSRLIKVIPKIEEDIKKLPKGSLQPKVINGKTYYYLVFREDGKLISKYVKQADLAIVHSRIKRRRELSDNLHTVQRSVKQIEKALGKEFIKDKLKNVF